MIPPFRTPGNASYFVSGFHSATTSPLFRKTANAQVRPDWPGRNPSRHYSARIFPGAIVFLSKLVRGKARLLQRVPPRIREVDRISGDDGSPIAEGAVLGFASQAPFYPPPDPGYGRNAGPA